MQVHEIMTAEAVCFRESDPVMEIARRMRELNIGFVPICDDRGRPVLTGFADAIALADASPARRATADDVAALYAGSPRLTDADLHNLETTVIAPARPAPPIMDACSSPAP